MRRLPRLQPAAALLLPLALLTGAEPSQAQNAVPEAGGEVWSLFDFRLPSNDYDRVTAPA